MSHFEITKRNGAFELAHIAQPGTRNLVARFPDANLQRSLILETAVDAMEFSMVEDLYLDALSGEDITALRTAARTDRAFKLIQQAYEIVFPEGV